MKNTAMVVVSCCAAYTGNSLGDTFVVPHVLEASGHLRVLTDTSPLTGPFPTHNDVDSFGPDENGVFNYNYFSPIVFQGTNAAGHHFELDFNVLVAQNRPEGGAYRFELLVDPVLVSVDGVLVDAHTDLMDLSAITHVPDPIAVGATTVMEIPVRRWGSRGATISMDVDSRSTLRIIPAPVSVALLALGGLFNLGRGRRPI